MGQHGPNIGPTWAQDGPNIARHRPNLNQYRPKMGPTWLNMRPTWPNISRWAQDGSTWARLGPTWAQPALNIGPDCFHTGKHCALCLPQFNIALPGFARRISAQSSHTISQKSLLGRRPAVRRKPLNYIVLEFVFYILYIYLHLHAAFEFHLFFLGGHLTLQGRDNGTRKY